MPTAGNFIEPDGDAVEKSKNNEATAQFAKMQRGNDAKQALSEYQATAAAVRAKTEQLKALRLARDAAAPPPVVRKRKAKTQAKGSLSDWLDSQAKEGRRG